MEITGIAFVANPEKKEALVAREAAAAAAARAGFSCCMADISGNLPIFPNEFSQNTSLVAAFGGDGTILRASGAAVQLGIPVLGVNLGRVAFLSEIQPQGFMQAIERVVRGQAAIEERMLLACTVNGKERSLCLNDALLYKRDFSGVTHIQMFVGGKDAGEVSSDGIVVSTPTGATGYSISAGGPIIAPGLDATIIAPVCPHSLCVRPIVTAATEVNSFRMLSEGSLYLDGRAAGPLQEGDVIAVTKADEVARFIRFGEINIYELIRGKLS
ncbi:MAG: NAD(+)/NADH kinase [Eubacteriales bacterium]|nr:NAD(+)/NADH kinase [Eubacteriales bacterium]